MVFGWGGGGGGARCYVVEPIIIIIIEFKVSILNRHTSGCWSSFQTGHV